MAKRNRDTLKNYLKRGALPSEQHFADLIDSSLNMIDEGFSRSDRDGIEITTHGDHATLASFFRGSDPERPTWSMSLGPERNALLFNARSTAEAPGPALTLHPDGKVGVNSPDPEYELDVKGVIRSEGRIGANPQGRFTIPADGGWHDIVGPLTGCQAFEVMAGVGRKKTGKYALMHAIAINTFQPAGFFFNLFRFKKKIRYTQAYYHSTGDKLKLRWRGDKLRYYLQLRTNTDYGENIQVQYHMTRLWFDEDMSGCWKDD